MGLAQGRVQTKYQKQLWRHSTSYGSKIRTCRSGKNSFVGLLKSQPSKQGKPLQTAARYGHAGVARILLSASSNPNLQNKVSHFKRQQDTDMQEWQEFFCRPPQIPTFKTR